VEARAGIALNKAGSSMGPLGVIVIDTGQTHHQRAEGVEFGRGGRLASIDHTLQGVVGPTVAGATDSGFVSLGFTRQNGLQQVAGDVAALYPAIVPCGVHGALGRTGEVAARANGAACGTDGLEVAAGIVGNVGHADTFEHLLRGMMQGGAGRELAAVFQSAVVASGAQCVRRLQQLRCAGNALIVGGVAGDTFDGVLSRIHRDIGRIAAVVFGVTTQAEVLPMIVALDGV